MTDMIAKLDDVLSATQANGAAALAANNAYFTVAYPAEISSQGDMIERSLVEQLTARSGAVDTCGQRVP